MDRRFDERPAGYAHKSGDFLPNPFVDEKPLFAITAQNLGQYADKLSAGQRALLKKYPDSYRLDIYPTHRTHAVPEWVARNIQQNAIKAKLVDGGNGIEGAYGGVPFPIPSSGEEVMWNHLLRWQGDSEYRYNALVVQPNGTISSGESIAVEQSAFYLPGGSVETFGGDYFSLLVNYLAPARRKGEVLLIVDPINQVKTRGTPGCTCRDSVVSVGPRRSPTILRIPISTVWRHTMTPTCFTGRLTVITGS